MNTFRKIGFTVMAVMACLCITSCSDDDEPEEGGNGSITATLDGENFNLSNAYWWIDDHHDMHIEFYSYNLNNPSSFPDHANIMTIDYEVPANVNAPQSVTLQSGKFHICLVQNITTTSYGWQAETIYNDTSNSPCIITRDGNNYTIKIERATVSDENTDKIVTFNYSGQIAPLPYNPSESE